MRFYLHEGQEVSLNNLYGNDHNSIQILFFLNLVGVFKSFGSI